VYLKEVDSTRQGVRAYHGELDAAEVSLAVTNPDEVLRKTGLDVDTSLPVFVQVQNVAGRSGKTTGSFFRVSVLLTDAVNVINLVGVRA
jgi:hypothetical protein